jgi:hypothetical protein
VDPPQYCSSNRTLILNFFFKLPSVLVYSRQPAVCRHTLSRGQISSSAAATEWFLLIATEFKGINMPYRNSKLSTVKVQVLRATSVKMTFSWDIAPRSLIIVEF